MPSRWSNQEQFSMETMPRATRWHGDTGLSQSTLPPAA